MVMLWFIGDSFKTLYFILRAAPNQFIACGSIQIAVDIMILYQVSVPRVNHYLRNNINDKFLISLTVF